MAKRGEALVADRTARHMQSGTVDTAKVAQFMAPAGQLSKAQLKQTADRLYADVKRGYNPFSDHSLSTATLAAIVDALDEAAK